MDSIVRGAGIDFQWFRIFVWAYASRLQAGETAVFSDSSLIPLLVKGVKLDQLPKPIVYRPEESWSDFQRRARAHFLASAKLYGPKVSRNRNLSRQASIAVRVVAGGWSYRRAAEKFGVKESSAFQSVEKFRAVLADDM